MPLSTLDYEVPRRRRLSAVAVARFIVIAVGIALPYLARIPGTFTDGPAWLTSYLDTGVAGLIFFGVFNVANWGAIVLGTLPLRTVPAILVAALVGFALPAYGHATLDLSSDAQASLGLIFIPIYSLPYVALGAVLGYGLDRQIRRTGGDAAGWGG